MQIYFNWKKLAIHIKLAIDKYIVISFCIC